jgi:hypothetical protein
VAEGGQGAIRPCGSSWSGPFSVPGLGAADSEYDACAVKATKRLLDGQRVLACRVRVGARIRCVVSTVEGPDAPADSSLPA